MKLLSGLSLLILLNASPVFGQKKTDPKETEVWEPVPKIVQPGNTNDQPPSDAIILFDGKNTNEWLGREGNAIKWKIDNNAMVVTKGSGDIHTRRGFGDCQLHIEWRTPSEISGEGQGRGNSGIFFMRRYELQVLDSYNNVTYSNGQAGSIYKQHIPLVNASKKPGEWQSYDVIFIAPRFNADSSLKSPARITVFHNGVLIQNNVEIKGTTEYIGDPVYKKHEEKAGIQLQDHGNPTAFRNIWIREL